jgi:hypothetical protein
MPSAIAAWLPDTEGAHQRAVERRDLVVLQRGH